MTDLTRLKAAARVPANRLLIFGRDPIHTWATENQAPLDPDRPCTVCGGAYRACNGRVIARKGAADPVRDYEVTVLEHVRSGKHRMARPAMRPDPLTVICGGCGRSVYDETTAIEAEIKTGDPGYEFVKVDDEAPTADDGYPLAKSRGGVSYDARLEGRDNLRKRGMMAVGDAARKRGRKARAAGRR